MGRDPKLLDDAIRQAYMTIAEAIDDRAIIAELVRRDAAVNGPIKEPPRCSGCFEGCPICTPMRDDGVSIAELRRMTE